MLQETAGGLTMRFMLMTRADEHSEAGAFPIPEVMAEMGAFMEEITAAGVLVSAEGLQPSAAGSRLRLSQGALTVTDGPFAETKEMISSFAIVNVASKAEAIEWASRWAKLFGEMECEIRPLFDAPPPRPQ
jgi:hypothetical protein